jgi:uncharacterized OB-fold protein
MSDVKHVKFTPTATPETQEFWDGCARRELWIPYCAHCEQSFFYPRAACPRCGLDDAVSWRRSSGRATLYSYVISYLAAPGYEEEGPYVIAVVELEEGPRMLTNLVGVDATPEALELDMPFTVDFEEREGATVPVFRPDIS